MHHKALLSIKNKIMMKILAVNNLQKFYNKTKVINDLSFSIDQGDVYGILGPNGSGKTTTLGILLGILKCNSGSYEWFIKDSSQNIRKKIGVLIETPNFYPYLSAEDNLKIIADIKNIQHETLTDLLGFVGLAESRKKLFRQFSLGMKQRLGIAATLIGDPSIIIFDEPTNGLDAAGIASVRELIRKIANQGKTIILASHLLDEIQKVCSKILIINAGKKVLEGRIDDLLVKENIVELAAQNQEELQKYLIAYKDIELLKSEGPVLVIKLKEKAGFDELHKYLTGANISLNHIIIRKESLENLYIRSLSEHI